MAMRRIKGPVIQNMNPNARITVQFPLGVTYEKLYWDLGTTGLTKAVISNIVLKINNKEFQRWATAADLDAFNLYKGNATSTRYLPLDFTERAMRNEVGMKLGTVAACQEAGVQSFTMEADIGTFTVTGGVAPNFFVEVSEPSSNRMLQRVQYQQKALSAAVTDIFYVPFGASGYQLKRMLFKHTNLSSVRVRRDGVDMAEDVPVALLNFVEQDFGRVPQAGYHMVDMIPDTLASNALNTAFVGVPDGNGGMKAVPVQNLDTRLTTSAADVIGIYTESFALNSQL